MRWFALLALVAACGDGHSKAADAAPPDAGMAEVALIPVTANGDVDLLFVIDDSNSVADHQIALENGFPAFVSTLNAFAGGLPNLHIGVVTPDLGTKGADDAQPGPALPGCSGAGKAGALQANGATQIQGNFIIDSHNPDGTRTTNYTGTLADAFRALASVGSAGCAFDQSIEAAKLALDNNPSNVGFMRPGANLGIIFLTDNDDCSMAHSTLMSNDTATLGPLALFRCTRFGVTCDQGGTTTDEMNTVGAKTGCHSNESGQYLTRISDYTAFFKGLKSDPRTVALAGFAGDPTPFAVELRPPPSGGTPVPALAHSCMYTDTSGGAEVADPAVRVNQLVGSFDRHQFASVCSTDLSAPMTELAHQIGSMVGSPCLAQAIAQPAVCQVFDETFGMAPVEIPECGGGTMPCYTIEADPAACPDLQHLKLSVTRTGMPPAETMVSVRCQL
jgi:hypothetical protein